MSLPKNAVKGCGVALGLIGLSGCKGPQSALSPAGHDADMLANLFWVMFAGSILIWAVVMGIAVYAARSEHAPPRAANLLILGGLAFTIAVLTALLVYGLTLMGVLRAYSEAV